MMMPARFRSIPSSPRSQRGAVLYVALVMLILLALIGIIGMQVTGLQEKMSANYRNVNMAFQNAEAAARQTECFLESQVNRTTGTGCSFAGAVDQVCDTGFDATNWAKARSLDDPANQAVLARSVGRCISGNSNLAMGVKPQSEDANPVFQVTVYSTAANATADAAVDTIFRP